MRHVDASSNFDWRSNTGGSLTNLLFFQAHSVFNQSDMFFSQDHYLLSLYGSPSQWSTAVLLVET